MFNRNKWKGTADVLSYIQSLKNAEEDFLRSKSKWSRQKTRSFMYRYAEQKGFCIVCSKFCYVPEVNSKDRNDSTIHNRATFDHIIPSSLNRSNSLKNCVMMCSKCNNDRGSIPYWMYRVLRFLRIPHNIIKEVRKTYDNNKDLSYTDRYYKNKDKKKRLTDSKE